MINQTQKNFKEVEEILSSAVQRGITIVEACVLLDKSPSLMNGILTKIETAFKSGVINEKNRDSLLNLYTKCTKIALNKSKNLKKSEDKLNKKPSPERR